MDLRHLVGTRIRAIRKVKGLTQQKLSELSGLDDAYIGSVERGERNFSIDTLEKIVKALEIQPTELFDFYSGVEELELAQREAQDNFGIMLTTLSLDQIETLVRILAELRNAFK
ncbi:helix-turn-helix domain-containing protein [Paenibacillus wenxiniae]|uniref:Helix-turn-helix domain-containing protein n=1 Tax=Paenibacillus wenxiniae TaxID=1636843 RepID=A0ABW4RF57_9BACL